MAPHGALPGCESGSTHCVTCGDEGVVMEVLRVDAVRRMAICVETGARRAAAQEIATDLVEPVGRGQKLLVHAGVALTTFDAEGQA